MFYHFSQTNSGGHFEEDDNVTKDVIIEAHNHVQANRIAEEIGIYFYGVANHIDCECCGDRWYETMEMEGTLQPTIYGTPITEVKKGPFRHKCYVYYLNKAKEVVYFQ